MPKRNDEMGTRKADTKSSKGKRNALMRHAVSREDEDENHKFMATRAYAKKRGFKGNDVDAIQDWLEVEVEIEDDDTQNVKGIEYQFLTNKYQQMN